MKKTTLLICMALSLSGWSQRFDGNSYALQRGKLIDVTITKTGPYLGIQKGKYTVLELGAERQWRKVKIVSPNTHAAHMGFNYNFKYNVLGYDLGYWFKLNRVGITYGGNLFYRTDFDNSRIGFAPVIGYKFWMLHLQTGYHFMARQSTLFETNTFFVSLRIGIINDRDIDVNVNRKKKGK